ncbi:MAG: CDP-alcohol phosphatidyltransferase family protein [Opitutaceae bacterium]|nr:CDP-alcohol phosphatidyltransferase family protein [Opitutaceae bacterium]
MPTIYQLKPAFQNLLRPIVGRLAGAGVTANQVTIAAFVLSAATGAALWRWPTARAALLAVPAVCFARMALNAIDGMLAREFGQKSKLGAILNELGDVLSDAALYLPFAAVGAVSAPLVVAVVLLAVVSEMAGVVGVQIGASRRYDGPAGKSDRAFVFGLIALLAGCGVAPGTWTNVLLAIEVALLAWTIVNRARGALRERPA